MKANQDTLPVGEMCRLLRVSISGYYGWRGRPMSAHARRDVELTALIHQIYEHSRQTYGSRESMRSCARPTECVWGASAWRG